MFGVKVRALGVEIWCLGSGVEERGGSGGHGLAAGHVQRRATPRGTVLSDRVVL